MRRNSNSVTMPKLPPPPRTPQNRSAFSVALACTQLAVGGDELDREQLVDGQPVLAHDPPDAAAERQPRHAGVGHDPAGHREPERLRRPVELARAARRPARAPCAPPGSTRIPFIRRQVDHDAVVADRVAGEAVAAAADGDGSPCARAKPQRRRPRPRLRRSGRSAPDTGRSTRSRPAAADSYEASPGRIKAP